jgi:hypothetical protein
MRLAGHVERIGEINTYTILIDKSEGKSHLGKGGVDERVS